MRAVVVLDRCAKRYRRAGEVVTALEDASACVAPGEAVAVVGASGSGKTTLLNLAAGVEEPDEGTVAWPGWKGPEPLPGWEHLALVPQRLGLAHELTVDENVRLPLRFSTEQEPNRDAHADRLLRRLGLDRLADRRPAEASLGEQQRAALARALVASPALVVADEPTSHQDEGFADVVVHLLREYVDNGGAVLLSTNDERVVPHTTRDIRLSD